MKVKLWNSLVSGKGIQKSKHIPQGNSLFRMCRYGYSCRKCMKKNVNKEVCYSEKCIVQLGHVKLASYSEFGSIW